MIEYRSSLEGDKKAQDIIVFYLYQQRIILGIASAILGILCLILSPILSLAFLTTLGLAAICFAGYTFYFWLNQTQRRRKSLNFLYMNHSVIYFVYRLSENEGVITDYCIQTRSQKSFKKSEIEKIIIKKDFILVKLFSGSMFSFPNTKEIENLLKK